MSTLIIIWINILVHRETQTIRARVSNPSPMAERAVGRQTLASPVMKDPLILHNANLLQRSDIILRYTHSKAKAFHLWKNQTTVLQEKQFEKVQR